MMLGKIQRRLSYANVMATVAVFIALSAGSYAAIELSRNSVRSSTIKNGQVKRADLGVNAVTSAKVRNGALLSADFKPGQLPAGPQGAQGPAGPEGPAGSKGDTGPQGPGARSFVTSLAKASGFTTVATTNNGLNVLGLCSGTGVGISVETTSGLMTFEGSGLVGKRVGSTIDTFPVATASGASTGVGFAASDLGHVDVLGRDAAGGAPLAHVSAGGVFNSATGCRIWATITPTT